MPFNLEGKRIWVAGHRGLVGSAIARRLAAVDCEVLTADRTDLDLTDRASVAGWLQKHKPDAVFLAAAKVGGILANSRYPASFLFDNLAIELNAIDGAFRSGVEKLLFLGSSCIYPREAAQPIKEEALLTGPLEPTNEPYALAKIAGIKLCESYRRQYGANFISAMPTNIYGPGDNFHPENSHVPAALIRRFHEAKTSGAKSVTVWGTGAPRREFLYVDDLADACVFLMRNYDGASAINVGAGKDITIAEFAALVREAVGFEGDIVFDPSYPDGMPRKMLDVGRMTALGWTCATDLRQGLTRTYDWFKENIERLRAA